MRRPKLLVRADLERQREAEAFLEEAVRLKEYPQEITFPGSAIPSFLPSGVQF
jgi:hypothetical protein